MSPHVTYEEKEQAEERSWMMGKEAFERQMPHHESIKALWETKWKFPVSRHVLRPSVRTVTDAFGKVLQVGLSLPRW